MAERKNVNNGDWDAKGDLLAGTANDAFDQVAVGANGTVLTADSAQTTGMIWSAPAAPSGTLLVSDFDAKGDLLVGTANDAFDQLPVGADGTVAVANANSTTGLLYAKRFGQPTYMTNGFYGTGGSGQSVAGGWVLNALYAVPIFIGRRQNFDRIGVRCGAGTATLVVRLGIYNDGNGPTSLVLDAGTVDGASATADKTITINQTLDPGLYWLAAAPQVAATIGASFVATRAAFSQYVPAPWTALSTNPRHWARAAIGSGALPNPVVPALADYQALEGMQVMLRAT